MLSLNHTWRSLSIKDTAIESEIISINFYRIMMAVGKI